MRILLVDDDSSVLQALIVAVKSLPGHDVRVAANAQKAHEHVLAMGGLDILITDVVMEPTDGITLRDELKTQYPRLRTAFISGYDLSDYSEHTAGAAVFTKPVNTDAVRAFVTETVQALLAPPQAAAVARPAVAAIPVAQAVAMPVPTAMPVAVPKPVPTPMPVVTPVPAATPVPVAASQPPPPAVPAVSAPDIQNDPLVGVQLGDYRVQKLLGKGMWGSVYLAIQLSVNRPVGLKVLDPSQSEDANSQNHFLADARAKAAVQHPFIVSVFEADERNGLVFYTQEYLNGPTLAELINARHAFDEKTALQVMKMVAEALNYLWSHNFPHGTLSAREIRFGSDNIPRLANLATSTPTPGISAGREIQTLSGIISQLVPDHAQSMGLRALLARMAGIQNPIVDWPVVLQAVKALEPKVIPVEAAKIKAADAVAIRAMQAARVSQKKALTFQFVTLGLLLAVVGFFIWKYLVSNARDLTAQIQIPAGSYSVGADGHKADLAAFEIDKYEVTIGEYAKFIQFCEANGGADEHKYDHPNAPRKNSHVTDEVKILIGKATVRDSTVFQDEKVKGIAVDLNCPMVSVSWWDAYAYANWKGRELPTEEEWEVAARGREANRYPWGNEIVWKKFNSNLGYKPLERGSHKPDDGYNYWCPVDEFSGDQSPFKVVGMAGNVAEWTYRLDKKTQLPVVKGGSFASDAIAMFERVERIPAEDCWYVFPANYKPKPGSAPRARGESERFYVNDIINADTRTLYIGFRTVKHK